MAPYQVHRDGVPDEERESKQDPGQVGSLEGDQSKEVHPDKWVPPGPDVHQHNGESLT